jgi:hypothetical protein
VSVNVAPVESLPGDLAAGRRAALVGFGVHGRCGGGERRADGEGSGEAGETAARGDA